MQVQFNRPVTINRVTYGKGVHEVPANDVKDNWFFNGLVNDGDAVVLREESAQEAEAETNAETEAETESQAETDAEQSDEESAQEAEAETSTKKTRKGK